MGGLCGGVFGRMHKWPLVMPLLSIALSLSVDGGGGDGC